METHISYIFDRHTIIKSKNPVIKWFKEGYIKFEGVKHVGSGFGVALDSTLLHFSV